MVGQVQEGAARILTRSSARGEGHDGLRHGALGGLSEYCGARRNRGWVAVQTYLWRRRLGRKVVVIAVSDAGIGFPPLTRSHPGPAVRRSLGRRRRARSPPSPGPAAFAIPAGDRDSPASSAICSAGTARFRSGSGTARLAVVPDWDDDAPARRASSLFPGRSSPSSFPPRRRTADDAANPSWPHCCARRYRPPIPTWSPDPPVRAVRGRIEAPHRRQSPAPPRLLDFSAIGLLDFSCADEVVAKLLLNGDGIGPASCCWVTSGSAARGDRARARDPSAERDRHSTRPTGHRRCSAGERPIF